MRNRIRVLRADQPGRALSQMLIARRSRISQTMLSQIECGTREPTPQQQKAIAKALRADVVEVFPAPEPERDDEPRRKLTRQERLQGLADRGVDTWDELEEKV